jgi:hypothetical protein
MGALSHIPADEFIYRDGWMDGCMPGERARASKEEIVIWLSNALFAIAKPLGTINDLIALQTHKKSLSCHLRMADKACPPPPPPPPLLLRGKIKSKRGRPARKGLNMARRLYLPAEYIHTYIDIQTQTPRHTVCAEVAQNSTTVSNGAFKF